MQRHTCGDDHQDNIVEYAMMYDILPGRLHTEPIIATRSGRGPGMFLLDKDPNKGKTANIARETHLASIPS